MPMMRFERIALAKFLVGGLAVVFVACVLIKHAQAQFVNPPSPPATTGLQSVQSQYRASTELQTRDTLNTKHNTFNIKRRSVI